MTIRDKLIGNVLVIAVIIACISAASYFSMTFIQKKITYLTEKSTPFQIQTVEFQSNLQKCVTDLVSLAAAKDVSEFSAIRAKSAQSLEDVKNSQTALLSMSDTAGKFSVFQELNGIAREIFANTETKLLSDAAAAEANARISQQMAVATAKLRDLDTAIRILQRSYTESFAQALKSTEHNSANLRQLEELKNILKELLAVSGTALNAKNTTSFLITKGKIRTLMGRIARNRGETYISSKFKVLDEDIQEFLNLGSTAVSHNDDEARKWAHEALNELTEYINRMNLELNQEIELASSRLAIETQRQGNIYDRSNAANGVLLANSELVALGLTVTSDTNSLFTITSPDELESAQSSLLSTFAKIHNHALSMEQSLERLQAKEVLKVLENAHLSLEGIRSELVTADGIVSKLKAKMTAVKNADNSANKLQSIIARQSLKGKENISAAQMDQKKAITAVHRMIYKGLSQIVGIGTIAVLCGILFGIWIYRSVLIPLRIVLDSVRSQQHVGQEKAVLVEAVAAGDLDRAVPISTPVQLDSTLITKDEIGSVLKAVVGMSNAQVTLDRAFADMTASLRTNRQNEDRQNRIKNGLFELNKILRDEQSTPALADRALAYIADFLSVSVAMLYQFDAAHEQLHPIATYAVSEAGRQHAVFKLGEGLAGQAALEKRSIILESVPKNYLTVTSALGCAEPLTLTVLPLLYNDMLAGVVELGTFQPLGTDDLEFLQQALEGIAIALNINHSRQMVNGLLEQAQEQAEELRQANEELEEKARMISEQRVILRETAVPS